MIASPALPGRHRMRGATLIDVLVGSVIGILAIVLATRALVATLAMQRSAAASAEAEQAALLSTFAIGEVVAGAGAGIAAAAAWLDSCPATADIATSLRPVSVLIAGSGRAELADSLTVKRTLQARMAAPAAVAAASAAGAPFSVRSPDGFAAGDRIVAIGRDGTCAAGTVTSVGAQAGGIAALGYSPATFAMPPTGLVLDLGPAAAASTLRLDVAAGSLRSTDVSNADAPNPLVANVVNVKFQYGIDRNGDGTLDEWVAAQAASGMDAASVLAAPAAALARIVAIRVGVLTRSEAVDPQATSAFHWTLFDCAPAPPAACPGRIDGTIAAAPGGNYRHATREAVFPLYNTLWNRPN
ncbi:MAG: PilW family protein [Proteobacteria bacterium]|nr:PilW family protein [Pseudomonadota bacterium]